MVVRELINLIGFEIDEAQYKATEERAKTLFENIGNIGKEMSLKVTAPIMLAAGFAVKEFADYNVALALTAVRLKGMGEASGKTVEELDKLSVAMADKSTYTHDEILKDSLATLLRFGNISGQVFDRVANASQDLAATGLGMKGAALMLGRALDQPAEGMSALVRQGIRFTDTEQAMIKSMVAAGRTADAQRFMLDKIEKSIGGTASAIRDAGSGLNGFIKKVKELGEEFGAILFPYMKKFYKFLGGIIDKFREMSPSMKNALVILAGLAAVIGPLLVGLAALGAILPAIEAGMAGMAAIGGLLSAEVLIPLLLVLAGVAALYLIVEDFMAYMSGGQSIIGQFLEPWETFGPKIMATLTQLWGFIKGMFDGVLEIVKGVLQILLGMFNGDFSLINKGIQNLLIGIVEMIWNLLQFGGQITGIILDMAFNLLKAIGSGVMNWLFGLIQNVINTVKSIPLLNKILGGVSTVMNAVGSFGQMGSGSSYNGEPYDPNKYGHWGKNGEWVQPDTSSGSKNVNVTSTVQMTVPAGTQQQQVAAVQAAAEQAVSTAWNKHLHSTLVQVNQ